MQALITSQWSLLKPKILLFLYRNSEKIYPHSIKAIFVRISLMLKVFFPSMGKIDSSGFFFQMSVANFGIWVSFTARVCKNPKLSETRPDPENWGISGFGLDKPDPHISPTRNQISGISGFESGLPQENSKNFFFFQAKLAVVTSTKPMG